MTDPLYPVWQSVVMRGHNEEFRPRRNCLCPEWREDFPAFARYVTANLPRYKSGMRLVRIDRAGDYEPGNVQWKGVPPPPATVMPTAVTVKPHPLTVVIAPPPKRVALAGLRVTARAHPLGVRVSLSCRICGEPVYLTNPVGICTRPSCLTAYRRAKYKRKRPGKSVPYPGVHLVNGRYQARMMIGGKRVCLGTRADPWEAACLYADAKGIPRPPEPGELIQDRETRHVLNDHDVGEVYWLYSNGTPVRELATEYGVDKQTIYNALHRFTGEGVKLARRRRPATPAKALSVECVEA